MLNFNSSFRAPEATGGTLPKRQVVALRELLKSDHLFREERQVLGKALGRKEASFETQQEIANIILQVHKNYPDDAAAAYNEFIINETSR